MQFCAKIGSNVYAAAISACDYDRNMIPSYSGRYKIEFYGVNTLIKIFSFLKKLRVHRYIQARDYKSNLRINANSMLLHSIFNHWNCRAFVFIYSLITVKIYIHTTTSYNTTLCNEI